MSAPIKQNAGFRWTDSAGNQHMHYLGAKLLRPVQNKVQPVHSFESADLTTRRDVAIGSGVYDLSALVRFDGNPASLSELIAAGRAGATLEYFPDLSAPALSFPCRLQDAPDIGPDSKLWWQRRVEVPIRLRRVDGGDWTAVIEEPLLYYRGGMLPAGFTFTRTGAAMTVDENGLLVSVADGLPRTWWLDLDGDGVMDTPALALERASQNEALSSEDMNDGTAWPKVNLNSVSVDQIIGPDGVVSLDELIEDATASQAHGLNQAFTGMTADANYAVSCWAVANTRSWLRLTVFETASAGNNVNAWFDLTNGVVGSIEDNGTGTAVRHYMEDWTHVYPGLYRCIVVGAVGNSATGISCGIRLATADSQTGYSGDDSSSLYAGYAQFEDDVEVASSYIPTTTVAVARANETVYATFPHQQQAQAVYVRFVEKGTAFLPPGATHGLLHIGGSGSGDDPRFRIGSNGSSDGIYDVNFDNGTDNATAAIAGGNEVALDDQVELLALLDANDDGDGDVSISQRVNGGAVTTPVTAVGPTGGLGPASLDWTDERIYFGSLGAAVRGLTLVLDVKIMPDVTKTLQQMAAL